MRAAFTPEAVALRAEFGHKFDETWSAFAFADVGRDWGGTWRGSAGLALKAEW